jgi:hypothetical protein
MSEFTVAIKLTPYLKEWFVHENGGHYPVKLIKNSNESIIMQYFLKERPADARCVEDANCLIYIPTYKYLDVRKFNYLAPKAIAALESAITNRFKIQMWKELHVLENCHTDIGDAISGYMEKHGISGVRGDTNWESIRQMYYRMRKAYHQKNESNNLS